MLRALDGHAGTEHLLEQLELARAEARARERRGADGTVVLDEEQFDALHRLVDVARRGLTVPRIALRYRLQRDTHGLDRSRHRITSAAVERGSLRPVLELDLHGPGYEARGASSA